MEKWFNMVIAKPLKLIVLLNIGLDVCLLESEGFINVISLIIFVFDLLYWLRLHE